MTKPFKVDDPWCQQIPLLHRILSGSASPNEFPEPQRVCSLEEACAVWEPLHYLLRFLLGWNDPGKGLAWWYAAGKPIQDSELLRIVLLLWDQNAELDYYAAWTWHALPYSPDPPSHVVAVRLAKQATYQDLKWWRTFVASPEPIWPNPFFGGTNPLHLGHSNCFGQDEPEIDQTDLLYDQKTRRAVLITNNISTWRRDLANADRRLPSLKDRSWYVQVFDQQHGCLGTFRKSRETGKWFQGKHSVHLRGNNSSELSEPKTAKQESL